MSHFLKGVAECIDEEGATKFPKYRTTTLGDLYLLASIMYYVHDAPIMTDASYDYLCKYLQANYGDLESEFGQPGREGLDQIDKSALEAGTGFQLREALCGQASQMANYLSGVP